VFNSNSQSRHINSQAELYLPGGASGADRCAQPKLVFTQAQGAYLFDADGRRYIDYHAAYSSILLGHSHPEVNKHVYEVAKQIDLIGVGTTELEVGLAKKLVEHIPSAEKVFFCNSGSEATYAAIRVARAATGRRRLVKFEGCFHGWHDAVIMNTTTPIEKFGQKYPESAGMAHGVADDTLVLPLNNIEESARIIHEQGDTIAAVILEPIPHYLGCILPDSEFLHALRRLTQEYGIVLIFDEVISGFRHGLGGYQKIVDITPDLTALGKAIANGYPLAAVCGQAKLMDHLGPDGDVWFSGTFNSHPHSLAAALTTVEILERPDSYDHLYALGERMRRGLSEIIQRYGVQATVMGFGSIFTTYFMSPPVENYADLLRNDDNLFVAYRHKMIEHGIYELPRPLKRNHVGLSHTIADIDQSLEAAEAVFKQM